MPARFRRELLNAATAPYRSVGRFAWHFARSKLKRDPIFVELLERCIIPDARRLVDLGCGQGLLASWLRSAKALHDAGNWPSDVPAPPDIGEIFGLELMPKDVERARSALAGAGVFERGDIRTTDFGNADVIVILDVLHYMDYHDQMDVLHRVRAALPIDGLLVTRVGDAAGGLPFVVSKWVDHGAAFFRGHRLSRLCCRSTPEWTKLLEQLGFRVEAIPMCRGTPFANVTLIARVDAPSTPRNGERETLC